MTCKNSLKDEKSVALYISMVVRNAMEDFHGKHLSDAQMKEINPIIRNAVYTALYALSLAKELRCTPSNWTFSGL